MQRHAGQVRDPTIKEIPLKIKGLDCREGGGGGGGGGDY